MRTLLVGSARARREEQDDEELAPTRARTPGKQTAVAADDEPAPAWAPFARVDRRAESDDVDDEGAFAGAMSLIDGSGGSPLPAALAARLSAELGVDLRAVRVHTDARAAEAAAALHARAFTIGDHIYFATGAYDPHGEAGVALIAHEVAHVAQQRRGTAPTDRKVSRPGDAHEREAEMFAEHFGRSVRGLERYSGPAAQKMSQLFGAGAYVARELVMLAEPSENRERLLGELTSVVDTARAHTPHEVSVATAIHRAGGDEDESMQQKRIAFFVEKKQKEVVDFPIEYEVKDKKVKAFAYKNRNDGKPYARASKEPWSLDSYIAIMEQLPKRDERRASDRTYRRDLAALLERKNAQPNRVTRVSDKTYAFIMDGGWTGEVDDIRPDQRKDPDYEKQFEVYFAAVTELIRTKRLKKFEYGVSVKTLDQETVPYDSAGADKYRRKMVEVVVAAFKADKKSKTKGWKEFHTEVMVARLFPAAYNGIQGNMFEQLVRETVGLTLDPKRPLFPNPSGATQPLKGDLSYEGNVILDAKAAAAGIDRDQFKIYVDITDPDDPIPGYFAGEKPDEASRIYKAVVYPAPDKTIATKAEKQIESLLDREYKSKKKQIWKRFFITPDPDELHTLLLKLNPTILLKTKKDEKSPYTFVDPPTMIDGVNIPKAKIVTDDQGNVQSGTVEMGIDMGGQFKSDPAKVKAKPKQIKAGENGAGTVDNQFDGFTSKLDQLLGKVDVDAKLVDGGVTAKVSLKGPAKIPKFTVDNAAITASYINGVLSVEGEATITHEGKKIGGTIKVKWNGDWMFDGKLTVQAEAIPGLQQTELGFHYERGNTKLYALTAGYSRKFGQITIGGTLSNVEYSLDDGKFSGEGELEADLGAFGKAKASAVLEKNEIKSATFTYDSPEFKYPPKSAQPAFTGQVSGTITYANGKFGGKISGKANVNVPGLKAVAGDTGLGLDVHAELGHDGNYSGSIATTTPLTFGKHLRIPAPLKFELKPDGSVNGSFTIEVIKLKWLPKASISCHVDATGLHVDEFHVKAAFGNPEANKFWGELSVDYTDAGGLQIGGEVNYKIKEGMVATGKLTYDNKTHEVSLHLTVSEIRLIDVDKSHPLFDISKKIPVFSVGILGAYIEVGFQLGFDFGFHLGLKPTVDFDGFSLETGEFKQIKAKLELIGAIVAKLTGTPKIGLGAFAFAPAVLAGGGGLKMPIVGEAALKPKGTVELTYSPTGGVTGAAKLDLSMTFGIKATLTPYAEFSVLSGLWNPKWEPKDPIAEMTILEPKELFNFSLDLGGDMTTKKDPPPLPAQNAPAPATPGAVKDPRFEQNDATPSEKGQAGADKTKAPNPAGGTESGSEGPFSIAALMPKLRGIPGVATAEKIMKIAQKVWNVVQPIWDVFKPLIKLIGDRIDQFLDLFENVPTSFGDVLPWIWKVVKAVLSLSFTGIVDFVEAVWNVFNNAIDLAKKLIQQAVAKGWLGVKRHTYYIWTPWPFDNIEFMAASEWKIDIPNVLELGGAHGPARILLSPNGAVAIGLNLLLRSCDVPVTYVGRSSIGEEYNDRWVGDGARTYNDD